MNIKSTGVLDLRPLFAKLDLSLWNLKNENFGGLLFYYLVYCWEFRLNFLV